MPEMRTYLLVAIKSRQHPFDKTIIPGIAAILLWPVDHTLNHHLPLPVLAILGDLESLERIGELECMRQEGFEVDQAASHKIDRKRANESLSEIGKGKNETN